MCDKQSEIIVHNYGRWNRKLRTVFTCYSIDTLRLWLTPRKFLLIPISQWCGSLLRRANFNYYSVFGVIFICCLFIYRGKVTCKSTWLQYSKSQTGLSGSNLDNVFLVYNTKLTPACCKFNIPQSHKVTSIVKPLMAFLTPFVNDLYIIYNHATACAGSQVWTLFGRFPTECFIF